MGFVIIRLQVQCSFRLEIGMLAIPQLKIGLGQLIMGCGKLAVDLNRVLKLYGGLAIFAIRKILLSTLKILLLSHIGITVTGGEHQNERAHDQRRTEMRETLHGWSPGGIVLQVIDSAYARVAQKNSSSYRSRGGGVVLARAYQRSRQMRLLQLGTVYLIETHDCLLSQSTGVISKRQDAHISLF